MKYILSIDQSTQSTRATLFDKNLKALYSSCLLHTQIYPKPGWVEHDAQEIWECIKSVTQDVVCKAAKDGIDINEIEALGIANQGETVVAWDSATGKPCHNAIVWQCSRTASMADKLKKIPKFEEDVHKKTGLFIDPYFSATKIKWLLENVPQVQESHKNGTLMAGTLDSFFIYKMTNGKFFATDVSTASRTMLFNINSLEWDDEILLALDIPKNILADVFPTCSDFGETDESFCGLSTKISANVVDQQAALFGHNCFKKGDIKCTYGTGCFMLMNIGDKPVLSDNKLITTIAWQIGDEVTYALDGGVYVAGAAFKWLKDKMHFIQDYSEIDKMALSLNDNSGVYFVTAFAGLGAPYWDRGAKGVIAGLTLDTGIENIVRAATESIAFQVNDVMQCMISDTDCEIASIKVDGGVSKSKFLMQFQSDISDVSIKTSTDCEVTSLGTAMLAGIGTGWWKNPYDIKLGEKAYNKFVPQMEKNTRKKLLLEWKQTVKNCINSFSE